MYSSIDGYIWFLLKYAFLFFSDVEYSNMMFSKLGSFSALMERRGKVCYSWETDEYKFLWQKIGGKKD